MAVVNVINLKLSRKRGIISINKFEAFDVSRQRLLLFFPLPATIHSKFASESGFLNKGETGETGLEVNKPFSKQKGTKVSKVVRKIKIFVSLELIKLDRFIEMRNN